MSIIPVAKALYLCDFHVGYDDGKVDLYGLFNFIHPPDGFPYEDSRFCVFAQLVNGLGEIPFFIDIRSAHDDELVWTTETKRLVFPDRTTTIQLALLIEGCRFDQPGVYLVELFCDNTWVCDAQLFLRE